MNFIAKPEVKLKREQSCAGDFDKRNHKETIKQHFSLSDDKFISPVIYTKPCHVIIRNIRTMKDTSFKKITEGLQIPENISRNQTIPDPLNKFQKYVTNIKQANKQSLQDTGIRIKRIKKVQNRFQDKNLGSLKTQKLNPGEEPVHKTSSIKSIYSYKDLGRTEVYLSKASINSEMKPFLADLEQKFVPESPRKTNHSTQKNDSSFETLQKSTHSRKISRHPQGLCSETQLEYPLISSPEKLTHWTDDTAENDIETTIPYFMTHGTCSIVVPNTSRNLRTDKCSKYSLTTPAKIEKDSMENKKSHEPLDNCSVSITQIPQGFQEIGAHDISRFVSTQSLSDGSSMQSSTPLCKLNALGSPQIKTGRNPRCQLLHFQKLSTEDVPSKNHTNYHYTMNESAHNSLNNVCDSFELNATSDENQPKCQFINFVPNSHDGLRTWLDGIADCWLTKYQPDNGVITSPVTLVPKEPPTFRSSFPLEIQQHLESPLHLVDVWYTRRLSMFPVRIELQKIVEEVGLEESSISRVERHGGHILIQKSFIEDFLESKKICYHMDVGYGSFLDLIDFEAMQFSKIFHMSTLFLVHHSALIDPKFCSLVRRSSRQNDLNVCSIVILIPQKTLEFCLKMLFRAKRHDDLYEYLDTNLNCVARYCKRRDTCYNVPVQDIGPHTSIQKLICALKSCHKTLCFAHRRAYVLGSDNLSRDDSTRHFYTTLSVHQALSTFSPQN